MARPLLRSAIILPPVGAALAMAFTALHLQPPATDVSRLCVSIAAGLLLLNLIAWVAREGHRFGREERRCVFLVLVAVAGGYYTAQQVITEDEFDELARVRQRALTVETLQLSREIVALVEGRTRIAPTRPAAPPQEPDETAWLAFEQQTVDAYTHRFSSRVRKARAELTLRNIRDRNLDALYQSPRNALQIRVVGERLAVLADRLRRGQAHGPAE